MVRAVLLLFLATAGCASFPPLAISHGDSPAERENLVRLLHNRAVAAFYDGRGRELMDSLDLALELDPDHRPSLELRDLRERETYRPRFLELTGHPAIPANRELPGAAVRAALYPVWGLPFDLIELPLKGYACIPGLGAGTAAASMVPGIFLVWAGAEMIEDEEEEEEEGERRRRPCDDSADEDDGDGFTLLFVGLGVAAAPVVAFLALNGLEAAVYWPDWDDRLEGWARCALWWTDRKYREPEGPASAFFANARRIRVEDRRIPPVRREARALRAVPVAELNRRVARLNLAIGATDPEGRKERRLVGAALARVHE